MKPRHAFLVRETALISPFGAPASESWFLDATLHERVRRTLEHAGLVVERVDSLAAAEAAAEKTPAGAVVALDSVAFSSSVLRHLLAAFVGRQSPADHTSGGHRAVRAALPHGASTLRLSHIDGLERVTVDGAPGFAAPLWAIAPGARVADARAVILPFREEMQKVPVPIGMIGVPETIFGVSDSYMVRVDHWAHILRLNQLAVVAGWMERWNRATGKLWFIWRALLGFPWSRGRLAASIRTIHRRAKVHHRAFIDGSVIEEGAEIGANAVVKLSFIGKGARVEDGAVVFASVLGPGAVVASGSTMTGAVLYPRAFAAQQKMQVCVFGEASVAFTGSYFYDMNFARNVQVAHRGRIVDCGDRYLSVCLGPWARVGGGVWIAAGREVPAGALVVQPTDGVLYKMDAQLAATRMVSVASRAMVDVGELPSNRPADEPAHLAEDGATRPSRRGG